ncbi:MAG: glycosyltransferase [Bradymonadia bacterium]
MPFKIATVRDPQSAEYLKSIAMRASAPERAQPLWKQALELEPGNATILGHASVNLLDLGRDKDVIELLTPVLTEHPRNIHLCNLLGVALFNRQHAAEALTLFEHCLWLDPEYTAAKESQKNARQMLGRSKSAPKHVHRVVQETVKAARRAQRPTLAVCMIAKDEAEFIAGAIESVQGVADEIIVVDTGSTDDTVAICEALGVKVGYYPWDGSFSTARNASLDMAESDWILCLDCDERLAPESRSVLKSILEAGGPQHLIVCPRLRNFTRDGTFMGEGFSGRLFRNVEGMRFTGRVHEEVGTALQTSLDFRLDLILDHYGADPEVMKEKAKDERNIELLEARLAERPDDLMTHFYLGSQHWVAGRVDRAREAFSQVVRLFERDPGAHPPAVRHMPVPYSYVGLVRSLTGEGRSAEAIEVADRALTRWPDNVDLWYHSAYGHIGEGQLEMARRNLQRSLAVKMDGYNLLAIHDPAIQQWRAKKLLGDIEFEEEKWAEAYALYNEIVETMPGDGREEDVVVRARLVELGCNLGHLNEAPGHVHRYIAVRPSEVDVAVQVAAMIKQAQGLQGAYDLLTGLYEAHEAVRESESLCLAIGQIAEEANEDMEALRWYERVAQAGCTDSSFWAHLAKLFLRLQQPQAAVEALQLAKQYMTAEQAPATT